ncbi:hypothetical protein BYT27DRAFT_7255217 [Phlegmacium glaucopus]|nr:hypothetical protein BYT27DRAFT_7255217 [Phlegmacium glaucopus]
MASAWKMNRIQKMLEPLAIAANVTQVSHSRLDHVLLMLGNLVCIYTNCVEFDEDLCTGVIKSLEKRWKKADQDIFIATVFLNPFIQGSLFNKAALNDVELHAIIECVYECVMRRKADIIFLSAFKDYWLKHAEFSDQRMGLELMKNKFAAEDAPLDLDVDNGRNAIVKLAIHIFSVVANSAGCKHIFSNFGVTHTKCRNKLDLKKVHKMAVVGMQIKRKDCDLGLARNWKKQKFEEITDEDQPLTSTLTDTIEHVDPTDFRCYAEGLLRQAELSNQEEVDDDLPLYIMPTLLLPDSLTTPAHNTQQRPQRLPPTTKTQVCLLELFNFTIRPEEGLEFYWPRGKKNLEEGLLAHENISEGNGANSAPSTGVSFTH